MTERNKGIVIGLCLNQAALLALGGPSDAAEEPLQFIIYVSTPGEYRLIFNSSQYEMTIDWGDGTQSKLTRADNQHTYTTSGVFTVTVVEYISGHMSLIADSSSFIGSITTEIIGSLPAIAADNYMDFSNYFYDLRYSTNAPVTLSEYILKNNPQIENLYQCFRYGGVAFDNFSNNILKGLTNLKNASWAFAERNITEIPEGFFDDCTQLENLSYCFAYNPIEKIPAGLFSKIFSKEYVLEAIIESIFYSNNMLTEIPDDLFNGCTATLRSESDNDSYGPTVWQQTYPFKIERIGNRVFYGCKFLAGYAALYAANGVALGDEIFAYTTSPKINHIPQMSKIGNGMFMGAKITGGEGLRSVFSGKYLLTEIGDYTFRDCEAASFSGAFGGCSTLQKIGKGTFMNSNSTDYSGIFGGCSNLTAVPSDTFDGCVNARTFSGCFGGCTSLTGEAPRLWEMYPDADGRGCFSGCNNLSNYEEIPANWK